MILIYFFLSSTKPVTQNQDETMNEKDKSERDQVEELVEASIPMESINKLPNLSVSKSAEILTKENRKEENFEKTNSNQSVSKSIKSLNRSVSKSAKAVNREQESIELGMISHKKSLITIFGHRHKILNFIKKF